LASDPSLRRSTWIVDPCAERRAQVSRKYGFASDKQLDSATDLSSTVNIAINATPSHLHVATTLPLIERGINVIVEKPLAEFANDAIRLIDAAAGKCLLSVNQCRRLLPSYSLVGEMIRNGEIGQVQRIKWSEGRKFDWPTQSGFYFRRPWRSKRARGALLDIGVHVLDQICWWLQETPRPVGVTMDGYGGPEAFVSALLETKSAKIDVAISFHSKLSNAYLVEGSRGALRGSISDHSRIEVRSNGSKWRAVVARGETEWPSIASRLIGNFVAAVNGGERLLIPPTDVIPALVAIDSLYDRAKEIWPECYWEWIE
jgi:predicted dehydrogenase